jgi:hypothetical protein
MSEDIVSSNLDIPLPGNRPARYRIVVGKQLSPAWQDRLGGMEIKPFSGQSPAQEITQLEGVIKDQAQLTGILNTLYDYGVPLLSMQILETDIEETR